MPDEPSLTDKNLKLDTIYDQLDTPTSITFLGKDDFLVSERNSGLIYRVINGVRLEQPLIDLNVSSIDGVLGLALSGSATNNKGHENAYVFVYYDENTAGDCECPPIASRLYRYDLVNNGTQLLNPKSAYQFADR